MKDADLRLTVERGKIIAAETASGLAVRYEDMFRAGRKNLSLESGRIEAAIQMTTFGSFWLEAAANECLRAILDVVTRSPQHASAFWSVTRRLSFLDKCALLVNLTPEVVGPESETVVKGANRVFDLRNRLAHFKPDHVEFPLPADFTSDFDGLASLFLGAPDSELIATLKSSEMEELAEAVDAAHALIDHILSEYVDVERHVPESGE